VNKPKLLRVYDGRGLDFYELQKYLQEGEYLMVYSIFNGQEAVHHIGDEENFKWFIAQANFGYYSGLRFYASPNGSLNVNDYDTSG